jgi:hypothetical protein
MPLGGRFIFAERKRFPSQSMKTMPYCVYVLQKTLAMDEYYFRGSRSSGEGDNLGLRKPNQHFTGERQARGRKGLQRTLC